MAALTTEAPVETAVFAAMETLAMVAVAVGGRPAAMPPAQSASQSASPLASLV
jgi:hypothetical protein